MDQHSGNLEYSDSEFSSPRSVVGCSDTESGSESVGSVVISRTEAADSVVTSDTESLGESVGSVEGERTRTEESTAQPPVAFFRRPRKVNKEKSGSQFMQFSIELRDVPVETAWEFIRSHKNVSDLVPGVIGDFDYLEGDGSTGSVFLVLFTREYTKRSEQTYGMYKVEIRDDLSHSKAVRCVGGQTRSKYYLSLMKVVPDDVLGDSSSVLICRMEYQLQNPPISIPKQAKMFYMSAMGLVRDRCVSFNRVDRPPVSPKLKKRLRLLGLDEQEDGRKSRAQLLSKEKEIVRDGQKKRTPRRKARVELLEKEDEEVGRDGQKKQMPRGIASTENVKHLE